jgi:hypothetical protein
MKFYREHNIPSQFFLEYISKKNLFVRLGLLFHSKQDCKAPTFQPTEQAFGVAAGNKENFYDEHAKRTVPSHLRC